MWGAEEKLGCFMISNNPSVHQQHLGVPDASDSSHRTLHPLREKYTLALAKPMWCVAYFPPALCVKNVVMYMNQQKDKYITLLAAAPITLWPLTGCLAIFMPFSS